VGKQKEDKKKELQSLEEEEIKLMEEINKFHSQGV
jgi:cell division protein FtsB